MWDLKYDTNDLIYQRATDSQIREQTYGYWVEAWEEGIVREFGMDVYTLLYLKWINVILTSI